MSPFLYPPRPVLIVDDEPPWLRSLALRLESALGVNHVVTAESGEMALSLAEEHRPSLVLLDITMPGMRGEEVLERLLEDRPDLPVIVHTAHNDIELAVRCTRLGACDYFLKVGEQERLIGGIRRALALAELRDENQRLKTLVKQGPRRSAAFQEIIGCSQELHDLCLYLEAVSKSREPLLITGESGTGKELVARALWRLSNPNDPWQAINVAGLDDHIFSDTLFGHVRGAYTGADSTRSGLIEQASGGVLFLDEIGDLAPSSQVKLLRLLQGGDYHPLGSDRPKHANVRIIAATNQDLSVQMEKGAFRRDLFYRLMGHQVHLSPLRERREDIPLLVQHFLAEAAAGMNIPTPELPDDILATLVSAPWPGNIRELRSRLFDAVTRSCGKSLTLKHFPDMTFGASMLLPETVRGEGVLIHCPGRLPTLEEAGEFLVAESMRRAGGNQTLAARMIGITRQGLAKRLKK